MLSVISRNFLFIFPVLFLLFTGCGNGDYVPKPLGYLRLEMPVHAYRSLDSTFPFTFDYSTYSSVEQGRFTQSRPNWFNLVYPRFNATIHFSYKDLNKTSLYELRNDAHEMAFKHAPKAIGIRELAIDDPKRNVYGLAYSIEGRDVASPFQFFVTDSTAHFLRGALYFSFQPNNDSLRPVIDYILADMDHLIETLRWK